MYACIYVFLYGEKETSSYVRTDSRVNSSSDSSLFISQAEKFFTLSLMIQKSESFILKCCFFKIVFNITLPTKS